MSKSINPAPKEGQVWRVPDGDLFLLLRRRSDYAQWCWIKSTRYKESDFQLQVLSDVSFESVVEGSLYVCDLADLGNLLYNKLKEKLDE